jgi:hypothetical protein
MKTTLTALFALTLTLTFQNLSANTSPFTATPIFSEVVTFTNFKSNISNNKVLLNWTITQNQEAYHFEVERSEDGKNFVMAAVVFGTDKRDSDNYMFYEKVKKEGTSYRIKVIQKDGAVEYSSVIVAKPNN